MTGDRDIEDHFDRATQAFLRGKLRPSRAGCPHPGLLLARHEGKLAGEEAAAVGAHLETCADCREQLATLVDLGTPATPEPPLVLQDPLPEARRVQPEPESERPIEFEEEFDEDLSEPPTLAPVPPGRAEIAKTPGERRYQPGGWRSRTAVGAVAVLAVVVAYRTAPKLDSQSLLDVWLGAPAKPLPASTAPPLFALEEEPPPVTPPAARPPAISAKPATVAKPPAQTARAELPKLAKLPPAPKGIAEPAAAAAGLVITARTNGDVRWRVDGARIERSDDRGRSWRPQSSHSSSALLAASAPSTEVCWAAGKNGAIVRTTDGRSWEAVVAPTSDDLVEVTASSAASAVVKSVTGQRYSTSDGGGSWSRL